MNKKSTTEHYTLSQIEERVARGEDRSHADAPEAKSLGEEFWKQARVRSPKGKTPVHLRIDTDIFDWFKSQGDGHLTRMNAVLRAYVDVHTRPR